MNSVMFYNGESVINDSTFQVHGKKIKKSDDQERDQRVINSQIKKAVEDRDRGMLLVLLEKMRILNPEFYKDTILQRFCGYAEVSAFGLEVIEAFRQVGMNIFYQYQGSYWYWYRGVSSPDYTPEQLIDYLIRFEETQPIILYKLCEQSNSYRMTEIVGIALNHHDRAITIRFLKHVLEEKGKLRREFSVNVVEAFAMNNYNLSLLQASAYEMLKARDQINNMVGANVLTSMLFDLYL